MWLRSAPQARAAAAANMGAPTYMRKCYINTRWERRGTHSWHPPTVPMLPHSPLLRVAAVALPSNGTVLAAYMLKMSQFHNI